MVAEDDDEPGHRLVDAAALSTPDNPLDIDAGDDFDLTSIIHDDPPPSDAGPDAEEDSLPAAAWRFFYHGLSPGPYTGGPPGSSTCCKVCSGSVPCGNSCIPRGRRCHRGRGCAC